MSTHKNIMTVAFVVSAFSEADYSISVRSFLGDFAFYEDSVRELLDESDYFVQEASDGTYKLTSLGVDFARKTLLARDLIWPKLTPLVEIHIPEEVAFSDLMEDACNGFKPLSEELQLEISALGINYDYRKAMISFFAYNYGRKMHVPAATPDFCMIYFLSYLGDLKSNEFWGRLHAGMIARILEDIDSSLKLWDETLLTADEDGEVENLSWNYMSILHRFLIAQNRRTGVPALTDQDLHNLINYSLFQ